MPDPRDEPTVRRVPPGELAPRLGIGSLERHVLFCDGPACCGDREGAKAWGALKRAAAAASLRDGRRVLVTKCDCLHMCDRGPIAVVYPDGHWYERVGPDEAWHLVAPAEEREAALADRRFAVDPLDGGGAGGAGG